MVAAKLDRNRDDIRDCGSKLCHDLQDSMHIIGSKSMSSESVRFEARTRDPVNADSFCVGEKRKKKYIRPKNLGLDESSCCCSGATDMASGFQISGRGAR